MKIDNMTEEAVDVCLHERIPFVLYALPGESDCRFYASLPFADGSSPAFAESKSDCFFINFFDNDESYTAGVRFDMTAQKLLDYRRASVIPDFPGPEIRPRVSPTLRVSYHDAFSRVIPRLKSDGGKVVLSRHRTILTYKFPIRIAEEYFSLTDSTFRYLCYTPETGVWLGSTPELLLESGSEMGEVRTMALAGTRQADDETPWDDKNIYEQSIVTEFIAETLRGEGLDVRIDPLGECRFLNIKHLCNIISARGVGDVPALMAEMSPTPAVAGYPRDRALDEINTFETHRRYCYGGYVGVRTGGEYHAYVNLRCCMMAPVAYADKYFGWLCNLYSGGGIVAGSREEEEWNETQAKTAALAGIMLGDAADPSGYEGPDLRPGNVEFLSVIPTF